jgi:Tol biopolymer transport system component
MACRARVFVVVAIAIAGTLIGSHVKTAHADDALPTLRVGDVTVVEGDAGSAVVNVPVDLSAASAVRVTAAFTLVGVNATAGSDFQTRKGTVSFPAGTTNRQISVRVYGDLNQETDETVLVNLSKPVNATLDDGQGSVTIIDDDSDTNAKLQINIGDVEVEEANGGSHIAYVPITLSQPAPSAIKLHYSVSCASAVDGSDYVISLSGTLTFLKGAQSRSLKFSIPANQMPEQTKTFLDSISVVSGPAEVNVASGGGTIVDDDPDTSVSVSDTSNLAVGQVARESVATDGTQADFAPTGLCSGTSAPWGSTGSVISADGRYVAFRSDAINLVSGDTNLEWDIFEHDRVTGTTERVSVATDGSEAPANVAGPSYFGADSPSISADGRYVTFWSPHALVPGVPAMSRGLYLHDRVTGTTELISKNVDGTPDDGIVDFPAPVSADGRYVAFTSAGSNLVAGDTDPPYVVNGDGNYMLDVYVHDRVTDTNTLVSTSDDGTGTAGMWPSMSSDGRYIAFQSFYDNIVPGDTNGCSDTFVRDMVTGAVQRVDLTNSGDQTLPGLDGCPGFQMRPSISADGSAVAFESLAWNLYPGATGPAPHWYTYGWHVYVRDLAAGTTQLVDLGFGPGKNAQNPSISANGEVVVYNASGGAMAYDRTTDTTSQIGELTDGTIPDDGVRVTGDAAVSGDGNTVVFTTWAINLIPVDDNDAADVYAQQIR